MEPQTRPPARSRPRHCSACAPEAAQQQLQPGWTDRDMVGSERTKLQAHGPPGQCEEGACRVSPSQPSPHAPENHRRLPEDRSQTIRRIPALKFGRAGEGTAAAGGRTHTSATHSGAIPHPGSPATAQHPASRPGRGEPCPIARQKSPSYPSRSPPQRARKKETALPTAALFTKSWFQALGRIAGAFQGPVSTRLTHTIYRSPQFSQSFPRDLSRNSLPRVSAASSKEARPAPAPPGSP